VVDVIVVGAGLAGMSAAHELADHGKTVLLLEARPYLGGRTSSWVEDGMPVESGLHKYLGFYQAMPRLLKNAGLNLDDVFAWVDMLAIDLPGDKPSGIFGAAPLHRPLETLAGIIGNNRFLPPWDKASLLKFSAAGLWSYFNDPDDLDRQSVAAFAEKHGVTDKTLQRVLIPLTAGLFFLMPEDYSAYVFFGIIVGALKQVWRTRIGAFRGGMTETMMDPLAASLERKGGNVQRDSAVERLIVERQRVVGVQVNGEAIRAADVVLAVSLRPAQRLLGEAFPDHPAFADMLQLETMPAVTLQLELDAPSQAHDWTNFGPMTHIGTFAEQSHTTFTHVPGRLSTILIPPHPFVPLEPDEIFEKVYPDLLSLDLQIEGNVRRYRVIKHPHDFYALTPGNERLRPPQKTPIPGLTLAGDYTQQPLFTSMEGAVISGNRAARCIWNT
jgi:15-cis-phytoene desaturase